jgi:hypothetical protein
MTIFAKVGCSPVMGLMFEAIHEAVAVVSADLAQDVRVEEADEQSAL